MPRKYDEKMFDIKHLRETAEKLKNWGKWGPDDDCLLYTSDAADE